MVIKAKLHVAQNILQLLAILKNKVTLAINKPANIGICILKLSKTLMYEFHMTTLKRH